MIDMLKKNIKNLIFNGDCDNLKKSLYHVLSLSIPKIEDKQMFLFNLDINKINQLDKKPSESTIEVQAEEIK